MSHDAQEAGSHGVFLCSEIQPSGSAWQQLICARCPFWRSPTAILLVAWRKVRQRARNCGVCLIGVCSIGGLAQDRWFKTVTVRLASDAAPRCCRCQRVGLGLGTTRTRTPPGLAILIWMRRSSSCKIIVGKLFDPYTRRDAWLDVSPRGGGESQQSRSRFVHRRRLGGAGGGDRAG